MVQKQCVAGVTQTAVGTAGKAGATVRRQSIASIKSANCAGVKRIAEAALATAWLGRSSYAAALPPDWLRLEPTDVVDVVFPSGTQFRMRLSPASMSGPTSRSASRVCPRPWHATSRLPSPMPARAGPCS